MATPIERPQIPARIVPSYMGPGGGLVPYRLAGQVAAGETMRLERRLVTSGIVRRLTVRLYAGANLFVKVRPYLWRRSGEVANLVQMAGKPFLDGDDDTWTFDLSHEVDGAQGWHIVVEAENTSDSYAFDVAVTVEVDHYMARAHGGGEV